MKPKFPDKFQHVRHLAGLCFVLIVCACSPSGGAGGEGGSTEMNLVSSAENNEPGSQLATWQNHMLQFGRQFCDQNKIRELSTWEGSIWYYDGIRVYYQIADYTGDSFWNSCARYVRDVYRTYVLESEGKVPGWRVFPHGLFEDFLRTGDPLSKQAVKLLATSSVFAASGGGEDFELSRETAYLIHAYLAAEDLGLGKSPQLAQSVNFALSHLDQWRNGKASYVKPFMVGLTLEALINYGEHFSDPRIVSAVVQTADWLWERAWDSSVGKFPYIICNRSSTHQECFEDHSSEGVDLHLLIAPAYAWAYRKTGDVRFRDRADTIFETGVKGAWLGGGKQFSQNYRWSFDYLRWRQ